jgi:putative ABC transport system substrate-binding protein
MVSLAAGLGLALPFGRALATDPALVAVTAIVEHPALDACRDGIREELATLGFAEGQSLRFEFQSAQGQPATAAQIARRYVGLGPSVIVPISTPSAQAVVAATRDIPVVFTAVTDPVGAGLVTTLERPGGNDTGLSDLSPIAQHLDLVKEIAPAVRKLGVPYNPGEANSLTLLKLIEAEAPLRGLTVVPAAASRSAEVQPAARTLVAEVDAIYVPTDNTVVSALEAVLGVARQRRIPVFAGDTDTVRRGAIATVGFDYREVGRQTAAIVARVLRGESPGAIPVRQAQGTRLVVNRAAAQAFGVELPKPVLDRASEVIDG